MPGDCHDPLPGLPSSIFVRLQPTVRVIVKKTLCELSLTCLKCSAGLNNSAAPSSNFEPWPVGPFSVLAAVRITWKHHNSQYPGCPPGSVSPQCSQDWSQHPQPHPSYSTLCPSLSLCAHTPASPTSLCSASKPLSLPAWLPHFLQVSAQRSTPQRGQRITLSSRSFPKRCSHYQRARCLLLGPRARSLEERGHVIDTQLSFWHAGRMRKDYNST